MTDSYQALVVEKTPERQFACSLKELRIEDLPVEEVLVRVHYSTVNYKDVLSCQGNPAITRRFPHTPGIDAAGVVEQSSSPDFQPGERVIVVARPMGLNTPGGFGQFIRVPASWLQKMAPETDLEQTMIFGTAGYTAALAVKALQKHLGTLKDKKIAVIGATGGVGCVAVALLNRFGAEVHAITGKPDAKDFLKNIGATEVITRAALEDHPAQNLLRPLWDGAIDVAGGNTLATLLKLITDHGCVAATGLADDTTLHTTVLPFILRGVSLLGINAENTDESTRETIWCELMSPDMLAKTAPLYTLVPLRDLPAVITKIAAGQQMGRIVVDLGQRPSS